MMHDLVNLNIENGVYKTRLTPKYIRRIKYSAPDEKSIRSVIPGTILDILVKPGLRIEQGTPLLVLEAMKMNNLVCSHSKGIIKNILVSKGTKVAKADVMIELE